MTKRKWLLALLMGSSIACIVGADPSPAQGLSSVKYRLQILPNEGGLSNPLSINNRDWVSGDVERPDDVFDHPGLWRRTTDSRSGNQTWRVTDLGTLGGPNADVSSPKKNENGWLAGASETAATDPNAENFFGWDCSSSSGCPPITNVCQGFLWREKTNKMIALPPLPGGRSSIANASNNNRKIAGVAEYGMTSQSCAPPQVFLYQGVVWTLNALGEPFIQRKLPPLVGDLVSFAFGMNDAGIVVGGSASCVSPKNLPPPLAHALLWKDGSSPRDLGNLGGGTAIAGAINAQGEVVGISNLPPPMNAVVHAFLWREGVGMRDLGSLLPDDNFIFPQSIGPRGEVVGLSCGPSEPNPSGAFPCDGFYWRNGVMIDLNARLTQPSSLQITFANDINDSGEIPVVAFDPNFNGGDFVAAVLIPQQGEVTSQSSQSQTPAAVQPSVSRRVLAKRFGLLGPRGWRLAH